MGVLGESDKSDFSYFLSLDKKVAIIFFVILGMTIFLRFYDLSTIPIGIFCDEAYYANDGILSFKNHDYKVFYEDNNGREGLFIWIQGLVQAIMDPSIFSLRLAPAIIGTLTVALIPVMFFYSASEKKATYNHKNILLVAALAAMFFTGCSYWHVNFSRIAFRAILDPLSATASVLFVSLSLFHTSNRIISILAGIICGIGLYGYGSEKFIIFPLCILAISAVWNDKRKIGQVFLIILFAFLTMLPLLWYIYHNPESYFQRLSQVSVFSMEHPLEEFMISLYKVTGMFFGLGDLNQRHNNNGEPQLNPIVFVFFVLGFIKMTGKIFSVKKNEDEPGNYFFTRKTSAVFICWWLAMMIPAVVTAEGQPHSLRAIGMIVPTMCIAGAGVAMLVQMMRDISFRKNKAIVLTLSVVTGFILFYTTYISYFERMTRDPFYLYYFDGERYLEMEPAVQEKDKQKIIILNDSQALNTEPKIQIVLFLMDYDLPANNTKVMMAAQLNEPLPANTIIFAPRNITVNLPEGGRLILY